MHQGSADSYWSFQAAADERDGASMGAGGFSPAAASPSAAHVPQRHALHRTVSEEVQQALGQTLGMNGSGRNGQGIAATDGAGGAAGGGYGGFDPMEHARLSPSAFDPNSFSRQFIVPRFASGGPSDPFGLGVGIADPPSGTGRDMVSPMPFDFAYGGGLTPRAEQPSQPSPFFSSGLAGPSHASSSSQVAASSQSHQHSAYASSQSHASTSSTAVASTSAVPYAPSIPPGAPRDYAAMPNPVRDTTGAMHIPTTAELESPVYAPYGSSVISINPTPNAAYKMPSLAVNLPPAQNPSSPFNPQALGLPVPPPQGTSSNFAGLYSASGFDMLGVLARVAARPNPQIHIGPVDSSCAFAVVDARRWDQPLVFVSDTFVKMTGYCNEEIIGRNCRFLQTPGGGTIQGAPRKYTDGNAAWHMRQHIQAGKESQSSLINYTKAGRPFINLVTIIPICWDTEEIAYFVGFQVDLVDQPNAILDRMRDGSYVVNYSLVGNAYNNALIRNPSSTVVPSSEADSNKTVSMQNVELSANGGTVDALDDWAMAEDGMDGYEGEAASAQQPQPPTSQADASAPLAPATASAPRASRTSVAGSLTSSSSGTAAKPTPGAQMGGAGGEPSSKTDDQLLDLVSQQGLGALELEVDKRAFNKFLLGNADDFVHVLSLKGSLLYCSPAVLRVLEYEASELVGATLSSLCHPSDVVPVMRQLKDASSATNPLVKLLYRIRRKHSGYVWIEAMGKLHIEPGKGRKCVIAVARPRDVLQMNWNELRQSGGLGDTEFWAKIDPRGTILVASFGTQMLLGRSPQDLVGSSLLDLTTAESRTSLEVALQQARIGAPATVQYQVQTRRGPVEVVTKFYPRHPEPLDPTIPQVASGPLHHAIIAQTNELGSEQRKASSIFGSAAPVYTSNGSPAVSDVASEASGSSREGSSSTGGTPFQSTFKTLAHPSSTSDNVFDELETRRPTSWQFELHQLQNINKKLRDEKDYVLALRRKRGSSYSERMRKGSSDAGSRASSSNTGRFCQNCGRTDSPEWRSGPNGNKTLCNACGLRWAKAQKQAAAAASSSGSPSSTAPVPQLSTAMLNSMTISPAASQSASPRLGMNGLPKLEEQGPLEP
ncbi:hypothetical protein Rhopal_007735-T1 [Rhodotorula paludigena]|uniref:White collar 1 protein n=1 Tax=Rhodotorula paludigena TaxID=86838 RepID=A0AAV5GYN3_9BASI|nr:hypothetical protein Rhopal_007735-T1 [Rhodotorula paludigena]